MGGAYVRRHHDLQTRIIPTPPLIDPRLHCSSPQPLGTLRNWSSTYGALVPHKALSCKRCLGPKKRRPVTIPFRAHRTDAKRKLPWIRNVAGLLAILRESRWLISTSALNSAGFSRFHSHSCSGGIRSDGPLALHPSRRIFTFPLKPTSGHLVYLA